MKCVRIIKTVSNIPFSTRDLTNYPWLNNEIRYYCVQDKLDEGAFADAFAGFPCNRHGTLIRGAPKVVIKIPKIDTTRYRKDENMLRLEYVRKQNLKEVTHIRLRLLDCEHANTIIDVATDTVGDFDFPVTIQLFVDDAMHLNDWLKFRGIRPATPRAGKDRNNWRGIENRRDWIGVSVQIACALRDIHMRRVTHGDIHPGNIFLHAEPPYSAVLIDFGEAFLSMPDKNHRPRNNRSYLAPERYGPRFPLNEQVDVYSFGMLMLYLATGLEEEMPGADKARHRRLYIHDQIQSRNAAIVQAEPRILDLIGRSTARDPADRPRMADIYEDLVSLSNTSDPYPIAGHSQIAQTFGRVTEAITDAANRHSPILMSLLERPMRELESVLDGLKTEMVQIYGTRDQTLRSMISLFEHLTEGDSWTTATTLAVWHGGALGRNGSYASANIRALLRGAAVRRTFMISVAELGADYCSRLADKLQASGVPCLVALAHRFHEAIAKHNSLSAQAGYWRPSDTLIDGHRGFFRSVVEFMHNMISKWHLDQIVFKDDKVNIRESGGLFVGICPVATLDEIGAFREDNPVSLMHFPREKDPERQWLLVMTEIRGRVESKDGKALSHLLGLRVFKTVVEQGVPSERILCLETLMNKHTSNVGLGTSELLSIVDEMAAQT